MLFNISTFTAICVYFPYQQGLVNRAIAYCAANLTRYD